MWIGERGELHVMHAPLWPSLGPVLRHRLAASPLPELRAIGRALADAGLDPASLFEEFHRAQHQAADPPEGEEKRFVGVALPQDLRLEVAAEIPADRLGSELVAAVQEVPPRWRPDVVLALDDLLWFLASRRPAHEHRDTVWRRYGERRRGRQHHARSRGRRRGR
jgi:hypothetical protein